MMVRWFGHSWGAPINESSSPEPVPLGLPCARCDGAFQEHDRGLLIWHEEGRAGYYKPYHLACFLNELGV